MNSFLLNEQISQDATFGFAAAEPITATPALFGALRLDTSEAGSALRVEFEGMVTFMAPVAAAILVQVFRGPGLRAVPVFGTVVTVPGAAGDLTQDMTFAFTGTDDLPPNPGFLLYHAFVSTVDSPAAVPVRAGQECLIARAYSG